MKKAFLAVFVLSLTCIASVFGQKEALEGLNIGAFIGPQFSLTQSEVAPSDLGEVEKSGRFGIQGGILADYGFTPYVGVQSGIMISTRGFRRNVNVQDVAEEPFDLTSSQNFTTLSIPLLVRGRLGSPIGNLAGIATIGINPEFNISYRNKFDTFEVITDGLGNSTVEVTTEEVTNKENVNVFTTSASAGVGVLARQLMIKLDFNLGLVDVFDGIDPAGVETNVKISSVSLYVGYFF